MRSVCALVPLGLLILAAPTAHPAGAPAKKSPKEALRLFGNLIGPWRATGEPSGTGEEKRNGFWQEKINWEWQFKKGDVHLRAAIAKGKHFTGFELRYLPERDRYQLKATTPAKDTLTFEGPVTKRRLVADRTDLKTKDTQRLVLNLLHANRFLYQYEVKGEEQTLFKPLYRVGATKEGVDFASDDDGPECVVSGGKGTIVVSYKGKTYYVCCTGCRDAFKDEPEKYIKEYEARKKAKKK